MRFNADKSTPFHPPHRTQSLCEYAQHLWKKHDIVLRSFDPLLIQCKQCPYKTYLSWNMKRHIEAEHVIEEGGGVGRRRDEKAPQPRDKERKVACPGM